MTGPTSTAVRRARGPVPGQGRLERGRLAQHRDVLRDGGRAHPLVGQPGAQPARAVLEQPGAGGGVVEDPVVAGAVLLVVRVLLEGPAERGRMGPRQDGERAEPPGWRCAVTHAT